MNIKRNVVAGVLAGLLVTGGTVWAVAANQPPAEVVASGTAVEEQPVSPRDEADEHREAPVVVTPVESTAEPVAPVEVAPAPVAPAPVVVAPEPVAPAPPPAPELGMPVPWIVQEGNTEGGYWDTTACPSSTASVAADGVVRCDP